MAPNASAATGPPSPEAPVRNTNPWRQATKTHQAGFPAPRSKATRMDAGQELRGAMIQEIGNPLARNLTLWSEGVSDTPSAEGRDGPPVPVKHQIGEPFSVDGVTK
jgi:hypothetical protein